MLRNLLILAAALSVAATATSASLNEAMAKRNGLDSGFFSRHAEGWFWYHDPVEEEPDLVPEPLPVMPPPAPSEPKETEPPLKPFTIALVRQTLDKYKEAAWNNPTPENVKAYFLLQRFVIERSNKFADVAQQSAFFALSFCFTLPLFLPQFVSRTNFPSLLAICCL